MKFSTDGGGTWQPDPELTSLVTNNGEFRWRNGNGTEAWTVGIDPEDSNRIFVGTELSGILASVDGGANWFRLNGTLNRVPEVSSFFFDEDHNIEYASSYGRGLWRVSFVPPVAKPGGPYSTVEGTDVALDGSASFDPDGGALSYSWDFNNDGVFGDATGPKPSFDQVGEEGTYTIWLKVTDPDGAIDVAAATVVVADVPPTVTLSSDAPKPEHSLVTVSGLVSDPGWLDPLTARIDWGDGTSVEPIPGTLENVRPDATLTFSVSHDYGDNGTFVANVCGNDDNDVCKTISLTITNVVPTAAIDKSGATIINGNATIIAHAGQPITFNGRSTDPGSDDLTVTWHWGDPTPDVVTTYLNNPPLPDPFPSPSVNPRDITDTKSHTFGDACLYTTTFGSFDDDGGGAVPDSVTVLITGNASERFGQAFWKDQYRTQPPWIQAYPAAVRACYLLIVGHVSNVFNEVVDASTFAAAENVLQPKGSVEPPTKQLDRELLAAWLLRQRIDRLDDARRHRPRRDTGYCVLGGDGRRRGRSSRCERRRRRAARAATDPARDQQRLMPRVALIVLLGLALAAPWAAGATGVRRSLVASPNPVRTGEDVIAQGRGFCPRARLAPLSRSCSTGISSAPACGPVPTEPSPRSSSRGWGRARTCWSRNRMAHRNDPPARSARGLTRRSTLGLRP
jgi:PKD domain